MIRHTLLALSSLFFTSLQADEKAYDQISLMDLSLEELMNVKITAGSFFEEKKEDIGSTITLITREEWNKRGAKNTTEAVSHIPGVHQNTHLDLENIVIRGFQNPLSYRGVLILVDGIPLNSYTFSSATQRIGLLGSYDQIELIKGPSSTLYGSDAFSGVMSLTTWDRDEDQSEIELEMGSFEFYEGSIKNVKHFNNGLKTTFNLTSQGQNNEHRSFEYFDINGNRGFTQLRNKREVHSLIGKINFKQTTFTYYRHYLRTKGSYSFNFIPLAHDDGSQSDRKTDMDALSLQHNVELNQHNQLLFKSYFWDATTFADYGNDPGPVVPGFESNIDQEDQRYGFEIKHLYHSRQDRLKIVTALSFERISTGDHASFGSPTAISNRNRTVSSLLVNADYKLKNEKVKLIAGGRIDDFSDINDRHFSPRLGLIYYHSQKHLYKLLYSNSFRAPNVQEIIGLGGAVGGGKNLKPEAHDMFELIYQFHKTNVTITSSAFFSRLNEVIQIDSVALEYQNKNPSEAYGFELESIYKIKQFELFSSASFINSWESQPNKNSRVYEGFPDWLINYGFEYKFISQPIDLAIYNDHRLGATNRQDSPTTNVPEGVRLRPYFRTDLTTTYHLDSRQNRHKFYFSIRNLFNRSNYLSSNETSLKGRKEADFNLRFGYRVRF